MKKTALYITLALFMGINFWMHASNLKIKNNHYDRFKQLTVADGLPNNAITVIKQDTKGFIWIGTRNGLARYDGITVRSFKNQPADSCSLSNNYITDIAFTTDGQMWVGTQNGLHIYNEGKACFARVPLLYESGKGISHSHIRALLPDGDGYMWIETLDGNLHHLNTKSFQVKLISHDRITQEYYDYHDIYQDKDSLLWVGGRNMGPITIDPRSDKVFTFENDPTDSTQKRDKDVAFFHEDAAGHFWLGGTDGLYQYNKQNQRFAKILATSTYDMAEDKHANLWIATGGGLYYYNSAQKLFQRYLHEENDPVSLIHNHVKCVYYDRDGNLWAGTPNGISIWLKNHNSIQYYRHLPHIPHSLSHNHVSTFLEDHDGQLWIGTMGGGINKYNTETDAFEILNRANSQLASDRVSALYEDAQNNLWIGLWQGVGFQKYNEKTGVFHQYAISPDTRKVDWYSDIIDYNDSILLTGIWGSAGLHLFDKKQQQFLPFTWKPNNHPVSNSLYHICNDDQALWTVQKNSIIYRFDLKEKQFQSYRSDQIKKINGKYKINSAPIPLFKKCNTILNWNKTTLFLTDSGLLQFDRKNGQFKTLSHQSCTSAVQIPDDKGLWFANEKGLFYLEANTNHVSPIEQSSHKALSGKTVTAIDFLNENRLIIGTEKGVLLYNTQLRQFESTTNLQLNQASQKPIRKFIRLSPDELLMVFHQGFAQYNHKSKQLINYDLTTSFANGLVNDIIHDACVDQEKEGIWLATDMGLCFLSNADQYFHLVKTTINNAIYGLVRIDHMLYLATETGLLAYNTSIDKLIPYNEPPNDILTSHLTSFVKRDQHGFIWSGTTNKGVNRIDPQTRLVEHFYMGHKFHGESALAFCETKDGTIYIGGDSLNIYNPYDQSFHLVTFDGLSVNDKIVALTEDDAGYLYVVTEHQLYQVHPADKRALCLNAKLGLHPITFTGGILKRQNGDICLGTRSGYINITPDQLNASAQPNSIQITDITVMGQSTKTGIKRDSQLTLSYDENFVTISFSSLDFANPNQHYTYQLTGINKNWVQTEQSSVAYTKLAPGHYTFKVKSTETPDAPIFQFNIAIKPPFWQSWWFRLALIIAVLSAVWYWWHLRMHKIKTLEANIKLRQRLLLAQMNPHFLFNTLTAIQGYIFSNQPAEAGSYLSKFARLMRLYLMNMRQESTPLNKELETLNYYLQLQKLRYNARFDYTINSECTADETLVGLPTMMIQPFVENAVEHGMKGISANGFISVTIHQIDKHWKIYIEDNGIGIGNTNESPKTRTSLSTQITQERLLALSQQYKGEYKLLIKDRSTIDPEMQGTLIEMYLPVLTITPHKNETE